MSFSTTLLNDIAAVGGGERQGSGGQDLDFTVFEDSLKVGRFAKLDTGSLDNMDASATPVIAGVVLRNPSNATEDGAVIDSGLYQNVSVRRQGFVTVDVKAGETPAIFDRVYASNAGDANDGLATATNTDVPVNGEFIAEVKSGCWLIYISPAVGDVATHIGDASAAHAASAISVDSTSLVGVGTTVQAVFEELDNGIADHLADTTDAHDASAISVTGGNILAATEVEAALTELSTYVPIVLADPGTGVAIPVTRSATVNLTIGSAGAETNTLAIPTFAGQRLILSADTVGTGTRAITCAENINQAANKVMTFAAVRDAIVLEAITVGGALRWQVAANDGVALS